MKTRHLTEAEIRAALGDMPIRQPEPNIRLRYVFVSIFSTGLFCGLMIADPISWLVEAMQ